MRQPERAKRRSRAASKLNELKRHAGVAGREPVQLDLEPAPLELGDEGSQELVTAAGRRRRELVEEREVGAPATRAEPVELNPPTSRDVS